MHILYSFFTPERKCTGWSWKAEQTSCLFLPMILAETPPSPASDLKSLSALATSSERDLLHIQSSQPVWSDLLGGSCRDSSAKRAWRLARWVWLYVTKSQAIDQLPARQHRRRKEKGSSVWLSSFCSHFSLTNGAEDVSSLRHQQWKKEEDIHSFSSDKHIEKNFQETLDHRSTARRSLLVTRILTLFFFFLFLPYGPTWVFKNK